MEKNEKPEPLAYFYGYSSNKDETPRYLTQCNPENYRQEVRDSIHNTLVSLPVKDFFVMSRAMQKSKFLYFMGNYEDISYIYDEEIKSIISSLYKEINHDKH